MFLLLLCGLLDSYTPVAISTMLPSLQPRPFQMLRCIVSLEQMSFQRFQGVPGVGFLGIFHGAMSFKGGQEALSKAS